MFALFLSLPACEGWTWRERGKERPKDGGALSLKVLGTKACDLPSAGADEKPRQLLGVEVELTSWSAQNVPASFFYATLDDGAGNILRALPNGCEPVLSGAPLEVGRSARGYVTFPTTPIARDSRRNYRLRYDPRLPGAEPGGKKTSVELALTAGATE
jgi:hypothetical protein